jgi:hypothetical protein
MSMRALERVKKIPCNADRFTWNVELGFQRWVRFGAAVTLLLGVFAPNSRAQPAQLPEYQVKAAFIFNFTKFVEWPASAFTNAKSALCIGVLGDNPFGTDLEKLAQYKSVDERPLVVRACRNLQEATNCHILFISASEKDRLPEIFKALRGLAVLTVSETDGFTDAGGMVNFVAEGKKIRFQINDTNARGAGLKISSKLLSLASPRRASAKIFSTFARAG